MSAFFEGWCRVGVMKSMLGWIGDGPPVPYWPQCLMEDNSADHHEMFNCTISQLDECSSVNG